MRLPLEPLEAVVRAGLPRHQLVGCPACVQRHDDGLLRGCVTDQDVADALGVTDRTLYRWRQTGISARLADRLAIRVGTHPLLVWGQAWVVQEILDDLAADLGIRRRSPSERKAA